MSELKAAENSAPSEAKVPVKTVFSAAFDLVAGAPQGVAKLRELILSLAVRGELLPQDRRDEPAAALLARITAAKYRLVADGAIKQHKTADTIADADKPFDLPPNWEWARLADLAVILNGRAYAKEELLSAGVPVLRVGNLFTSNHWYYSNLTLEPDKYCDIGDLLFAWSASFGPFIWQGPRAIYHYHIWKLNLHSAEDFNKNYLYTYLLEKTQEIKAAGHGVSMVHMTKEKMEKIVVPVPPLAEQARIVARVEELMQLCDALEARGRLQDEQHARLVATLFDALAASESAEALAENWRRIATHFDLLLDRPEAVDALEQILLHLAVRGLLVPQDPADEPASVLVARIYAMDKSLLVAKKPTPATPAQSLGYELPQGWISTQMGVVFDFLNGYAFKSDWFKPHGVRLVRNVNVAHGSIVWTDVACIERARELEFERFALQAGDVVISLDRPIISTGLKYAVVKQSDLPCLLLQRVARLSVKEGVVLSDFVELWLNSPQFVSSIDPGRSNGVPHISTKQLASTSFPLPPFIEQQRIVDRVKQLRRLCSDLRDRLWRTRMTKSQLADALVSEATQSLSVVAE